MHKDTCSNKNDCTLSDDVCGESCPKYEANLKTRTDNYRPGQNLVKIFKEVTLEEADEFGHFDNLH